MFFFPPPFMVEALSHFLWPDSRDPVAGVVFEALKANGQPAPVLVETGAGVHVPELHQLLGTFCRYWLRSPESEAASKKERQKHSF